MVSASTLVGLALVASQVAAHGGLFDPKPTFLEPNSDPTRFCGTIDGPTSLPGSAYNQDPGYNAAQFAANFKTSKYKTLKAFLDAWDSSAQCGQCGITKVDAANPQPLPSIVKWRHGDNEGFTPSHEGPCELWCDETRVYYNDDCAKNIPDGSMPIDTSKCAGAKQLTMLWMALHTPQWQAYKNCVAIGSAGPSPSTSKPTDAPTDEPSDEPTNEPTEDPTDAPTSAPTDKPTDKPTEYPTDKPTTAPTTKPTPKPTTKPTVQPTSDPEYPTDAPTNKPSNGKVALYYQCGGANYKGNTECVEGAHCVKYNPFYYQCRPDSEGTSEKVAAYMQCGGKDFIGATTCVDGYHCGEITEYFFQCRPAVEYGSLETMTTTEDDHDDDEDTTRRLRHV